MRIKQRREMRGQRRKRRGKAKKQREERKKSKGRKGNGRESKGKDTIGSAIYHCPYSLLLPKFKEWPVRRTISVSTFFPFVSNSTL